MTLTVEHIEQIKAAADKITYGKITIIFGTANTIDMILEERVRLPIEKQKN